MRIVHLRCGRLWNNVEMAETISTWQHFFHCTELQPPPPPLSTRSETDIVGWKPCQRKAAKSSPQYVLQTCPGSIWTPSSGSVLDRQVVNADLQRNSSFQALSVSYPDVYSPYNLSWRAASAGSILGGVFGCWVDMEGCLCSLSRLKLESWSSKNDVLGGVRDNACLISWSRADRTRAGPHGTVNWMCVNAHASCVHVLFVCLFVCFVPFERTKFVGLWFVKLKTNE